MCRTHAQSVGIVADGGGLKVPAAAGPLAKTAAAVLLVRTLRLRCGQALVHPHSVQNALIGELREAMCSHLMASCSHLRAVAARRFEQQHRHGDPRKVEPGENCRLMALDVEGEHVDMAMAQPLQHARQGVTRNSHLLPRGILLPPTPALRMLVVGRSLQRRGSTRWIALVEGERHVPLTIACACRHELAGSLLEDAIIMGGVGFNARALPSEARVEKVGAAAKDGVVGGEVNIGAAVPRQEAVCNQIRKYPPILSILRVERGRAVSVACPPVDGMLAGALASTVAPCASGIGFQSRGCPSGWAGTSTMLRGDARAIRRTSSSPLSGATTSPRGRRHRQPARRLAAEGSRMQRALAGPSAYV